MAGSIILLFFLNAYLKSSKQLPNEPLRQENVSEDREVNDEDPRVIKIDQEDIKDRNDSIDRNFNNVSKIGEDPIHPIANGVYFAQYQGVDVVFTNMTNENGTFPISNYQSKEDWTQNLVKSYDQLSNPKLVFVGKEIDNIQVSGFELIGTKLYMVINSNSLEHDGYTDTSNFWEFDLEEDISRIIIQKKLFDDSEYGYAGTFYIHEILSDDLIIFQITGCYACTSEADNGYFVLKLTNDEFVEIGKDVGGFEYNKSQNKLSFRKLVQTGLRENCIEGCAIYEAIGEESSIEIT